MTDDSLARLAHSLGALSSPVRLRLLTSLRMPQALNEIRIRGGELGDGPLLSRQTISHHLEPLLEIGLVRRLGPEDSRRGAVYVLDHARLYGLLDAMRALAQLRAKVAAAVGAVDETTETPPPLPPRPRLVVAYGRDIGAGYRVRDRALIGRGAEADVCLDYDPFLSTQHAVVERSEKGFRLRDLGSTNGSWVNDRRVPPHGEVGIGPADLITVGRSILIMQP